MFDVLVAAPPERGPYEDHQNVERLFDETGCKEGDGKRPYLFVRDPIDASRYVIRTDKTIFRALGTSRPLPDVERDEEYHFCVRVSPVKRDGEGGERRMVRQHEMPEWQNYHLGDRAGILVEKSHIRRNEVRCNRGSGFILLDVVIVGRLRVLDPERLRVKMAEGIGRHRAFGFGLLQLFSI